eukprot:TRINITY_DN25338_c0_g1_i1.p3 TRINITY_DN25338_c0_g1~~TRINITY_DN25338_c0_g1_i1.p3  ORF type:complete len:103 (+),score=15.29 TRINITY_DN25338_c0_g1_i1:170-478(+)
MWANPTSSTRTLFMPELGAGAVGGSVVAVLADVYATIYSGLISDNENLVLGANCLSLTYPGQNDGFTPYYGSDASLRARFSRVSLWCAAFVYLVEPCHENAL